MFEENFKDNLYLLWNRMSSGTYMPEAVKGVEIPKKQGGVRLLGIPTVMDRIAQTAVKMVIEPRIENIFIEDSYGYRPKKSALDAIGVLRERCWKYKWLIEFDIKKMFDNISHDLIMKAVKLHVEEKWCLLLIERWLKASIITKGGFLMERESGTPQGGVISPLLANLFMHYAFDKWITSKFPEVKWVRYADDGVVSCRSEEEARKVLSFLNRRFKECGLELHEEKTKIVWCNPSPQEKQKDKYNFEFVFLGHRFCRGIKKTKESGELFLSFNPRVSKEALRKMRERIKEDFKFSSKIHWTMESLAESINAVVSGWNNYYSKYGKKDMIGIARYLDQELMRWYSKKYKHDSKLTNRVRFILKKVYRKHPKMFAHWKIAPVY
jgi:RNA-directed DNA polymerase